MRSGARLARVTGFQLVVGVPVDKVTGLEPHTDELLAITKNSATHQSWITSITDAEPART